MPDPTRKSPDDHGIDGWVGRERVSDDVLTVDRARKLAATLDTDPAAIVDGAPLPLGWHWTFFHRPTPRSGLAADGHERRGGFLPPVPLPRRMWAGGRIRFLRPLPIGTTIRRVSTVRSVEVKEGRSGRLAFVTVEHRLHDSEVVAVVEEQDIVYLERPPGGWTPSTPTLPPRTGDGASPLPLGSFTADEVTLFRFSALTFNGHRIHYDRRFAQEVEGYPDLVVHGPLIALLLLDAGSRWRQEAFGDQSAAWRADFEYRALQPLFCGEPMGLFGAARSGAPRRADLWAVHETRGMVMKAQFGPVS
ncbi:MAG: MaoC family dehydratase N-terminal domain-containing protein [Gemmatimonadetes bacterium]|nr:MaoC family dehydratase N-terminal domain-containing protein [Gemmatimonadota bacterium]